MAKGRIALEVLMRRDEIYQKVQSGELSTAMDVQRWINKQGVPAKDRHTFANALKTVFPNHIRNGRWSAAMVLADAGHDKSEPGNAKRNLDEEGDVKEALNSDKPVKNGIDSDGSKDYFHHEESGDDCIRTLKNGVKLGKEALRFVDEDMLRNSAESVLIGVIKRNTEGRQYMKEKFNSLNN